MFYNKPNKIKKKFNVGKTTVRIWFNENDSITIYKYGKVYSCFLPGLFSTTVSICEKSSLTAAKDLIECISSYRHFVDHDLNSLLTTSYIGTPFKAEILNTEDFEVEEEIYEQA